MSKRIVHYRKSMGATAIWEEEVGGKVHNGLVGGNCFLYPIDHPNHVPGQHVSNTKRARTSTVVAVDIESGMVETLNTIYLPE